jgi:uncharacterized RDD family membrane protein YckC
MSTGTNLLSRTASKSVDLILVFAIMEALPSAGWLAGVLYVLIGDGLLGGQSLGKKLTGLRVIGPDGRPCNIKSSMLRNAALGLGLFLFRIPLLGWLILIALVGFEFVTLIGSAEGRRFGDELAGTSVIEAERQDDRRDDIV